MHAPKHVECYSYNKDPIVLVAYQIVRTFPQKAYS